MNEREKKLFEKRGELLEQAITGWEKTLSEWRWCNDLWFITLLFLISIFTINTLILIKSSGGI